MKTLTFSEIAKACKGRLMHGTAADEERVMRGVVIDSRKIEKDFLFVAIAGERVDGHDFIDKAYEQGAALCMAEREVACERCYLLVDSTRQALIDLAAYYRSILPVKVIGITGSVGKTSTKEMVASVLAQRYRVLKTQGNFNNEIGVPLTVFGLEETDEVAVLEMGISDFGEMTRLAGITRPDIGLITNIGQCHLENLKDRDGVLKAKTELLPFVKKGGFVLLNGDDDKLRTVEDTDNYQCRFFGLDKSFDVYAEEIEDLGMEGSRCYVCFRGGTRFRITIPIPGRHMIYNALAGALAGQILGLTIEEIQGGIESLVPVAGRNNRIETEQFTIIDDCYNANPMSMRASLDVLLAAQGRKVAILGDMGELGAEESELHRGVGEYAGEKDIQVLICVGQRAVHMAEGARKAATHNGNTTEVYHFLTLEEAVMKLPSILQKGDTVLVKASHMMEFPKIVDILKNGI